MLAVYLRYSRSYQVCRKFRQTYTVRHCILNFDTVYFIRIEGEVQITLTNDYAFKRFLGSEENKPILQNLLECILDIPTEDISNLELMDKELAKEDLEDKTGILDVKLRLTNGTVIDSMILFTQEQATKRTGNAGNNFTDITNAE